MDIKIKKVLKTLSDNNANLLFSTDNGAMDMYTNPPGYNGYLEMQYWADAEIPLAQIFKAATYNNAKTFNLLDLVGTIQKGKTANILLLDKNPLETVDAYNSIEYVIINGELVEREELSIKQ